MHENKGKSAFSQFWEKARKNALIEKNNLSKIPICIHKCFYYFVDLWEEHSQTLYIDLYYN